MFISFEGVDGSGKTTQIRLLTERLRAQGTDPLLVREPGGTELSERIRELLLDAGREMAPMTELLLFSAARAELVRQRILPALEQGRVVVSDRFVDSTVAYQGAGRQLDEERWMEPFNERVIAGVLPRRTYYIEVPLDVARSRRDAAPDRMEQGADAFYGLVAARYAELARLHPDRILRLDGTRSPEALHERIWSDWQQLQSE